MHENEHEGAESRVQGSHTHVHVDIVTFRLGGYFLLKEKISFRHQKAVKSN